MTAKPKTRGLWRGLLEAGDAEAKKEVKATVEVAASAVLRVPPCKTHLPPTKLLVAVVRRTSQLSTMP